LSGAVVLSALLPNARAKLIGGTTTRNWTEKSVSEVKLKNNAFDRAGAADTPLNVARKGHTATLLSDGKVLVVGGENQNGFVAEAEIFDPATGIFNFSGNLNIARADHSATLLSDGRVLIAGGRSESGVLNNTEIFDPTNGVFSNGPNLTGARTGETATLISDGRIVFAGGDDSGSVEIYDPSTNNYTLLRQHMTSPRSFHGAASLNDGRILFVGGVAADGSGILSGEILNIAADTFESVVNSLTDEHVRPTLHVLPDGKVQIFGGSDHEVMEIYDPATNQFGAHAHLYPNGDDHAELVRQLLAAGSRAALFRLGSANALTNRAGHAITELAGCNHALITGGVDSSGAILNTAAVVSSSRATITTDKLDYSPGTPVIVTGTGWQPLEFVTVIFHEDPHVDTENPHTFIAQADAYGNFTNEQYAPEEADKGVTYILAAEGASSLRTAQTTFTDASPGSLGNYATVGLSGTTAPAVVAASNVAANVTFSNLSRGSGLTASAATDAFNSSSWPTTTSLTVAGNTDYYEFTITPNASYRFSASELRVGLQRSSAGPAFVELRSSLDSFGSTIGSVISVGTSLAKFSVTLSAVPGLQNRASGVTFRLYGYNASSGGGTLRIQQILSPAMVGLEVDGVVTSAGSLQLSSSTYSDSETNVDHTFNIPVTRTGGSGGAVSVNFSVTDDTATTGDGDYTISPASGTLHWADGDSSSKNIAITVKGDAKYEADETINVSISSPDGGATLGSPANAVVTITNDDAQPSLSIDDVTQSEGNSGTTAFIFTVSKNGSTAFDVLLDYATQDGTTPLFAATAADNDYLATSGSVTLGANETTRTITVAVQGDTHIENDETFFINLSNATGATIAHSQGVGTIQNDDALFASDDNYNTEEDTPLNIGASGVLSNDSESGLTAVLISGPSHATSFNMNIDGSFTYTPAANYNGTDHFTYKAKNAANVESNVATVTLTITALNDAPFAVDDSATIDEDMPKNLTQADLKSNDTDVDNTNAQLSVTAVSSPLNGIVVLNGDGTVTFAPAPNFNGIAGFYYTVSDGNLTDAG
ncbi:MAG TPA: Ig-like domain-containing protein, partial [Pyrinomonadaceae bacterium]|nr:Ig-like domain-containing protein [Pyrinomonadaceae bacterium]